MKKSVRRLAFGALAAAAAMQFAACRNRPETVYGPPEYFTKTAPENNVPEVVYGPPEYFTQPETQPEEVIAPETGFSGEDNIAECLYGPPEMMETWQQETGFVPEENEPVDVYGPPSMFRSDDPEEAPAETSEAEVRK